MSKTVKRDLVYIAVLAVAILAWNILWEGLRDPDYNQTKPHVQYIVIQGNATGDMAKMHAD